MVFMLELPEDQTPSSPVYLLVAWRVAMEAGDENCMQVALIQDAKQSLPIDDEEWEEFLLKLGQSVYQPNQSEKLYYNVEGIPMGMLAKMTHGATATLSIRLKSGDGVLAGNPDITLQAPGTLDQWDMATSPLPMDSNMIYGNMSDNAGPFSPLLSSIHNSYSATTFLTVTINNRHNSLILRPSAVCMVAGSCASPLIDDLFPQASNKLEIMSAMRPVTCSGLIMMQLCTEDGLVVAGEPYMVIGWDIDQEMEERHFFARICDNPYKSSNDDYDTDDHTRNNGNSGSGNEATAANIIGSGDLDGIKTDQKTLRKTGWHALHFYRK
ncbi:hypothetical protein BDF22DRAFT_253007 [Syncephalis plumigaleata]|nr:hypothetical protein BDF22DRAFT_253007 [Syncephalis plumigaleata]